MNSDVPEVLRSLNHFLSIRDLEAETLRALVDFAILRKRQFLAGELRPMLAGRVLAMIFQKSSLRTRLGFEAAMAQLGGHAIHLDDHHIGLARREPSQDIARVISSMCDGIVARVFSHQTVVELAAHSRVPVINGLSDWAHPCQALADVATVREHFGRTDGLKLAYVGDANNVARSLANACPRMGITFSIASPEGYGMEEGEVQMARQCGRRYGADVVLTTDPFEAVRDADIVYTDVWTSMGQEHESDRRDRDFAGYQVNTALLKAARPTAVVMHCLPARRNLEITPEVVDGPQSIIFPQAANRLHTQRALLEVLLDRPRPC